MVLCTRFTLCLAAAVLLAATLVPGAVAGEVTIGSGTGVWNYPLSTYYHDARTQTIYLASEIGGPCRITSLSLDVTQPPGQTMDLFTIRMRHTDLSAYGDGPVWESADWTAVYQSDQAITSTGWAQFEFATPFEYDGTSNLMVDISFNSSSYTTDGMCSCSTPGGIRSICYRTDSGYGDPLSWSGTDPTPVTSESVPNVRLATEDLNTTLAPSFSPAGGTYSAPLSVTVRCATPDAIIHYTTNGADPTEGDPTVTSGAALQVDHDLSLRARAWSASLPPSSVKTASYHFEAPTPVFSPTGGAFTDEQQVIITCAVPDAAIHYTTNDAEPTESDPVIASGASVTVDHSLTLKARAWLPGVAPSAVRSAYYHLYVAEPVFTPDGGGFASDPSVTITCATPGAAIHYTLNGEDPTEADATIASGDAVTVQISPQTTLKAKGWRTGFNDSTVKTAVYRPSATVYVSPAGDDADNGLSWATAKRSVQAGIDTAGPGDQVWIAAGTYKPTDSTDRDASISLKDRVSLYGGFAATETSLEQRNWVANPTTLSGDLLGNDNGSVRTDEPTRQDNSYHVVTGANYATPVLDGFTITGGNANMDGWVDAIGGGLVNYWGGKPVLRNCRFIRNSAMFGSAVFNNGGSDASVENCFFSENCSDYNGTLENESSSPTVAHCTFSRNTAANYGAAIYSTQASSLTVTDCVFEDGQCGGMLTFGGSVAVSGCTFARNAGGMSNSSCNAAITNCTFTDNSLGGMGNSGGNVSVIGCTFLGNSNDYGGGMSNISSSPTVANCTFVSNVAYLGIQATSFGGGMYNSGSSSPTVSGCTFTGNSASDGGGMSNYQDSSPRLVNCVFSANTATGTGGAVSNAYDSIPVLTNCTFSGNSSPYWGGAISSYWGSGATVTNCILWGDTAPSSPEIYDGDHLGTVTYSDVQGGWPGTGNINADPLFADAPASDLRLTAGSPCIDAGWNDAPGLPAVDLNGSPRIANTTVDMGAYEGSVEVLKAPVLSPDGGAYTAEQQITITCDSPGGVIRYTVDGEDPTEDSPTVVSGQSILVDHCLTLKARVWVPGLGPSGVRSAYYDLYVATPAFSPEGGVVTMDPAVAITCTTPGAVIHYTLDGADPTESDPVIASGDTLTVPATPSVTLKARAWRAGFTQSAVKSAIYRRAVVYRVALGGDDTSDGLSWGNAKATMQAAIDAAAAGDQVWVAAGTYKPTSGTDRSVSITLKDGVAVYGGFGGTETALDQRNWVASPTIISGDLLGNDNDNVKCDEPTRQDNSYHVVTGAVDAVLDGFTVAGGNAGAEDGPDSIGGGVFSYYGRNPSIANCVFSRNSAGLGGAVAHSSGAYTITDCTFTDNHSRTGGGVSDFGSPTLSGCTFTNNSADSHGGAIYNGPGSSPSTTDCTFTGNTAGYYGGAVCNSSSTSTFTRCTFAGNTSVNMGGGVCETEQGTMIATDCSFTGNTSAQGVGGGLVCGYPGTTVTGCLFSGNSGPTGGGLIVRNGAAVTACTFTNNTASNEGGGLSSSGGSVVSNCIFTANSAGLWGGGVQQDDGASLVNCSLANNTCGYQGGGINSWDNTTSVTNCIVWGNTTWDGSQIAEMAPGSAATFSCVQGGWPGEGNISTDPLFLDAAGGDLHLQPSSLCVNAGSNSIGLPAQDRDGNPRIWDGRVDMGAYERHSDTQVQTPAITPMGSQTDAPIAATISCATPEATIRYTTNGADPTEGDLSIDSGQSVTVDHSLTIKAKAWKQGLDPSGVASAAFRLVTAAPTFTPDEGAYDSQQNVTIACTTAGAVIHYTTDGSVPTEADPAVQSGQQVAVSVNPPTTLIARAWKPGLEPSESRSALYRATGMAVVIHVAETGNDANSGHTWVGAKRTLTSALEAASAADQIWVATGTYRPTQGLDRYASFYLKPGVNVYGGFAGDETSLDERNAVTHRTVLSGDLLGDDNDNVAYDEPTRQDDSYSVITGASDCLLDGFTLRDTCVAVTNSNGGAPTITNCRFERDQYGIANSSSSPTVTSCVFVGCLYGMTNFSSSGPTVSNCTFTRNVGTSIYNDQSAPTILNCTFSGNTGHAGAAISINDSSSPTITGCFFIANSAEQGGAIKNHGYSNPSLANCVFVGNVSTSHYGGAFYNNWYSNPTFTNCTFVMSSSNLAGAAVYNYGGSPTFSNCLFWQNSPGDIFDHPGSGGTSAVAYCDLPVLWPGEGNISADPTFVRDPSFGLDGTWGTDDDDYGDLRLQAGSPCVNAGTNDSPGLPQTDVDGKPRIFDSVVDIGAYECDLPTRVAKPTFSPDGGLYGSQVTVTVTCGTPDAVIHYTTDGSDPDETDPVIASSSTVTVLTDPPTTLRARAYRDGREPSDIKTASYGTLVIRVSPSGDDAGDGANWPTAKRTVQAGIDAASLHGGEVWVAAGTYKPTDGTDRSVPFRMKAGVALYGGFTGAETERPQRNWTANQTILSGDIGVAGNVSDNSYHVVVGADDSVLDGFTITGGNANDAANSGGGVYCGSCSPLIANCTFTGNMAKWYGGAVEAGLGGPTLTKCVFLSNSVGSGGGGGAVSAGGAATISDCTFTRNTSTGNGGGLAIQWENRCVVTRCAFNGNSGLNGGGIESRSCYAAISDCTFVGNKALGGGGGGGISSAFGTNESPIIGCTFVANSAGYGGGGIYNNQSSPVISNCILWGNVSALGPQMHRANGANPSVAYCDIQGGWSGTGNMNASPSFVRSPSPGSDGVWGTSDDDYGDLRLQPGSPCIDAGWNDAPGISETDMAGNARIWDDVDVGAYEYVVPGTASMPLLRPAGGLYNDEVSVTVSCPVPGATIRYTTNGLDPQESDAPVQPGSSILVDRSLVLKAKAWRDGLTPSLVRSATYTTVVATPEFSPESGTFNTEQQVTITCATPGAVIRYTTDGVDPTWTTGTEIGSGQSILVDRTLTLKVRAWKGGLTPSDVNSAVYNLVVTTPSLSPEGGTFNTEQQVTITCATPGAVIRYTTDGVDPTETTGTEIESGQSIPVDRTLTLKVRAWKGSLTPSDVNSAVYNLVVATPSLSPDGGTFNIEQQVTITCTTPGAVIRYTTNGLDPTESDPLIESGQSVLVDHTLTLKARAWKDALTPSNTKSATYTLLIPPGVPQGPTPTDGASGVSVSAALQWLATVRAASYDVYLWKPTDQKPATPTAANIANTSFQPSPALAYGTNYKWQVVAKNAAGSTDGPEWSFETQRLPDLQVSQAGVPSTTVWSGQTITISWRVANAGDGSTGSATWHDRVCLSADQTPDASDYWRTDVQNASYLAVGEAYESSCSVVVPKRIYGTYHVIVQTDSQGNVAESNELNNGEFVVLPIQLTPPPDLQVASVNAPSNAWSGQPMAVGWTVANRGNGPVPIDESPWKDALYLSTDATLEVGTDHFLGVFGHTGGLPAGQNYAVQSQNVSIPGGLSGDYYVFVITDAQNVVFEYTGESNNSACDATPVRVNLTPPPDLIVRSVAAPASANSGQSIPVSWTVENQGAGGTVSTAWSDSIYISQDSGLDISRAQLVKTVWHSSELGPGLTYSQSASIALPRCVSGPWYVLVVTDSSRSVSELDPGSDAEDNNTSRSPAPVEATFAEPDLRVSSVTAPQQAAGGQPIALSWTVTNAGSAASGTSAWKDSIYLSADETLGFGDVFVGAVSHSGSLAPGQSYTQTASPSVPNCLSGSYHVLIAVDSYGNVAECDPSADAEANNVSSAPDTVEMTSSSPDLTVTSVSGPQVGVAGQAVTVDWTVTNSGTAGTGAGNWGDRVYLCPTPSFSYATSASLAVFPRNSPLAAGSAYTRSESVTLPAHVFGTYYLYVQADTDNRLQECSGETNNISQAGQPMQIDAPAPDLRVTSVSASDTAGDGAVIPVSWHVSNAGAIATSAPSWIDAVYLSSDQTLERGSDILLRTLKHADGLQPSGGYDAALDVTIPFGVHGSYYLIVSTDDSDAEFEGNSEGNNVRVKALNVTQSPYPDIVVTSVNAPETAFAGQSFPVNWQVNNITAVQASAPSWTDYVYLSKDQSLDSSDIQVAYLAHEGGLAGSGSYSGACQAPVPASVLGYYYVLVVTDRTNKLYEANEQNNAGSDPVAIGITSQPPADLVVSDVTVPASGLPGQNATITWTATNQGANPATGEWWDSVYLSTDSAWDVEDRLVGRARHTGPVSDAYKGSLTAALPGVVPGSYHVIVRADIRNSVVESNETNNAGASAGTVQMDVEELRLSHPIEGQLSTGAERYYKVQAPVGEDLLVRLDSQSDLSANELFVRYGAPADSGHYDFIYGKPIEPDQEITVPSAQEGWYYVMVRGASVPEESAGYEITASLGRFCIGAVYPSRIGNTGTATLAVRGAKLSASTNVILVAPDGTPLEPLSSWQADSLELWPTFDVSDLALGTYDVRISDGGLSDVLPDALTVASDPPGFIRTHQILPEAIRAGLTGRVTVEYENAGATDAIPPLLLFQVTNATVAAPSDPTKQATALQYLAMNDEGPAQVLPPGAHCAFRATVRPSVASGVIQAVTRLVQSDNQMIIDWAWVEGQVKPSDVDPAVWASAWATFTQTAGSTWGGYVRVLNELSAVALADGKRLALVSELLRYCLIDKPSGLQAGIFGRVYLDSTSHPLGDAVVIARQVEQSTIYSARSEPDGSFSIYRIPAGSYELSVQGYYTPSRPTIMVASEPVTDIELMAASGGAIEGTVRDGAGSTLADVRVEALSAQMASAGTTDSSGRYRVGGLGPGTYDLTATREGLARVVVRGVVLTADETISGVDFALGVSTTVSGTITDASSQEPVPDVQVAASLDGTFSDVEWSGSDGAYLLAGLSAGSYEFTLTAPGYRTSTRNVDLPAGQSLRIDVALVRAAVIQGTITDASTSAPIAGIAVQADGGDSSRLAYTDQNGHYEIADLTAGQYVVGLGSGGSLNPANIEVAAGSTAIADFSLAVAGRILGRVLESDGVTPVADAGLWLTRDGRQIAFATSAGDGSYSFLVLGTGTYDVTAFAPGHGFLPRSGLVISPGGQISDMDLVSGTARITGTVRRAEGGAPVAGAAVVVELPTGSPASLGAAATQTGEDGTYSLAGLPAGSYTIHVTATGLAESSSSVTVADGEQVSQLEFSLIAGAVLQGTVRSGSGVAVADTAVYLYAVPGSRPLRATVTDANGSYEMPGLAAGSYRVVAASASEGYVGVLVSVAAGAQTTRDLALAAGTSSVAGVVRDDAGVALPETAVTVTGADGIVAVTLTDSSGAYLITGLAPGDYTLTVERTGHIQLSPVLLSLADGEAKAGTDALLARAAVGLAAPPDGLLPLASAAEDDVPAVETAAKVPAIACCPECEAERQEWVEAQRIEAELLKAYRRAQWAYAKEAAICIVKIEAAIWAAVGLPVLLTEFAVLCGYAEGTAITIALTALLQAELVELGHMLECMYLDRTGCSAKELFLEGSGNFMETLLWDMGELAGKDLMLSAKAKALFGKIWRGLQAVKGAVEALRSEWRLLLELASKLNAAEDAYGEARYATIFAQAGYEVCCETCGQQPPAGPPDPPDPSIPDGPGEPDDNGQIEIVRPVDPNEKAGPASYGPQGFVPAGQPLPYTVYFENVATATAPAQTVHVTDQLDPNLDPRTFRLGEIVCGNQTITVPENRSYYQTRIDLGTEHGGIAADISAGLDVANNRVFWTLTAVDPMTGESPENPMLGLLPPNDSNHAGEGHVTYTIKARAGLATGTHVVNKATIIFDNNEPIDTNTVTNTVDGVLPMSSVAPLPQAVEDAAFTVSWSGQDDIGGSGIKDYDVYVREDQGQWSRWLSTVAYTDAVYTGTTGHAYAFYSTARDNAGNVERAPAGPDTSTVVGTLGPTDPTPVNGATGVPVFAQLSWKPGSGATSHDVYLWPEGAQKPETPTAANLKQALYQPAVPLASGTGYHWQVLARGGAMGSQMGSEWTFGTAPDQGAAAAKRLTDGAHCDLAGVVVTAVFPDCFYVETAERSSGLRIQGATTTVMVGDIVSLSGVMGTTVDHERCLNCLQMAKVGTGSIKPIGMPCNALGGGGLALVPGSTSGQCGVKDGAGANNIGLLVSVWGRVTYAAEDLFYVDDGSGLRDGSGHVGVRVHSPGLASPVVGSVARVAGISTCHAAGDDVLRVLRAREQADIFVLRAAEGAIYDAKKRSDGASVALQACVVTAVFPDCFYIESSDRACGLRVHGAWQVETGDVVATAGTMGSTADSERFLSCSWLSKVGTGDVKPIGVPAKALGGGDLAYNPVQHAGQCGVKGATGANNIGLLVSIWGKVTHAANGVFYIDDGSGLADNSGHAGVKVEADGLSIPVVGSNVRVTGISSCFASGDSVYRLLRARSISDITVLKQPTSAVNAVKKLGDGTLAMLGQAVVSAVFPGCFYAESADRTSGIRVLWEGLVQEGLRVETTGVLRTTSDFERYLQAQSVTLGELAVVEPLGITGRWLGGFGFFYDPITGAGQRGLKAWTWIKEGDDLSVHALVDVPGLNNTGLLVKTAGKVVWAGGNEFYLDDGSGLDHGDPTLPGVRVMLPAGTSLPQSGDFVTVTGISSCYLAGENIYRLLRVSKPTDVMKLSQ